MRLSILNYIRIGCLNGCHQFFCIPQKWYKTRLLWWWFGQGWLFRSIKHNNILFPDLLGESFSYLLTAAPVGLLFQKVDFSRYIYIYIYIYLSIQLYISVAFRNSQLFLEMPMPKLVTKAGFPSTVQCPTVQLYCTVHNLEPNTHNFLTNLYL